DPSALPVPYIFDENGRHIRTIDVNTGETVITFNHDASGKLVSMTNQYGQDISLQRTGSVLTGITGPYGHETEIRMSSALQISAIEYEDGGYNNFTYTGDGSLLARSYKSSYSSAYERFYDQHGRVTRTTDPEGGAWDFFSDRVGLKQERYGFSTAENSVYQTVRSVLESGDVHSVTTEKNGTVVTDILQADRLKQTTEVCGATTVVDKVRDTKTQEEIPSVVTVTQPSGLKSVTAITKVYGDNGANYLHQTMHFDANGRESNIVTDYAAGESVTTSAEGRLTRSEFDPATGRVTLRETDGLLPVVTDYDSVGRPTTITQGARSTRYYYQSNAQGQV